VLYIILAGGKIDAKIVENGKIFLTQGAFPIPTSLKETRLFSLPYPLGIQ
jgi:hypothetical protein